MTTIGVSLLIILHQIVQRGIFKRFVHQGLSSGESKGTKLSLIIISVQLSLAQVGTSLDILTNAAGGAVGKIRFFTGISRKNKEFCGENSFFCDILPIFFMVLRNFFAFWGAFLFFSPPGH